MGGVRKSALMFYETSQTEQVMNGNLEDFIYAYLRWELSQEN